MKRLSAWRLGLAVLMWLAASAEAAPPFTVSVDGERLSVRAQSAPLDQLLVEIGRQSAVEIKIESVLQDRVAKETASIELGPLPIEDALRRLLQGKNTVFLYSSAGLSEVRIYLDGTGTFRTLGSARKEEVRTSIRPRERAPMTPGEEREARRRAEDRERAERPDLEDLAERLSQLANEGNEAGAAEAAFAVLERDRDPQTRETALGALVGLESVPVDPLLRVAETETNAALKIQALELLGEHGRSDPRVSALLAKLAKERGNADVRETAGSLLENLKTPPESAPVARRPGEQGPSRPQRPSTHTEPGSRHH